MTAMLSPSAEPRDTAKSSLVKLLTLSLDDTRDNPTSARYSGGVDATRQITSIYYI